MPEERNTMQTMHAYIQYRIRNIFVRFLLLDFFKLLPQLRMCECVCMYITLIFMYSFFGSFSLLYLFLRFHSQAFDMRIKRAEKPK